MNGNWRKDRQGEADFQFVQDEPEFNDFSISFFLIHYGTKVKKE